MGNPYYEMLGLLGNSSKTELGLAVLLDAAEATFSMEGQEIPMAGRAAGLVLEPDQEGNTFLCAGNAGGWFVVCPLVEC